MALSAADTDSARRIGDVLRTIDFTERRVVELLGMPGITGALERSGPILRRAAGGSPLETVIRLFIGGARVDAAVAARAVAPTTVEEWERLGLLERVGDEVRARLVVRPHGELLVTSDPASHPGAEALAQDYVMGLSPSTLALDRLTVRRAGGTTLDVGTGGGFQALRAATHCRRVVATDVNQRALRVAAINLALNGVHTVELREGDLLDPVADERFDLVVSNPPFIVGPDVAPLFLGAGREGDDVCRELARGVPHLLADGGYCQFFANWVSVRNQPWMNRLASWFEGSSCDVWVMRASADPPDEYAATWICADTSDPVVYARRFARWLHWFDEHDVDGVGFGLITMRKRTGTTWYRCDDVTELLRRGTGAEVERIVAAETWLAGADDATVAHARFTLAPDAHVLVRMEPALRAWRTTESLLTTDEGLGFSASVSREMLQLLAQYDGSSSLVDLVEAPGATVVSALRALVRAGLLVPPWDRRNLAS